jgi:hypothetical protein
VVVDVLLTSQQFLTTVQHSSAYLISDDVGVLFEEVSILLSAIFVPHRNVRHTPFDGQECRETCSDVIH